MLTANEIYSVQAKDYDGSFWVSIEFQGREIKVEGISRSENETPENMREAGYVFVENGYEFGRELWVNAEDLQS